MKASCHCGNLTASIAEGAEALTLMCHCLDCQRRTGSPFGTMAWFDEDAVEVLGAAQDYSWQADSRNSLARSFCPNCGSTVYARASRLPDKIGVPVGALSEPSFPAPILSAYEQSKHDWVVLPEGMHHFSQMPPGTR